jgi:hypothetical protein
MEASTVGATGRSSVPSAWRLLARRETAPFESSCVGAELVTALATNCVVSGGEKIVTSDIYVGATLESDVLGFGEGVADVEQMH